MHHKKFPQLDWDISALAVNPVVRTRRFGIPREAKAVRYPVRLLRYWFGYHLLREEAERLDRAVEVAEVGVHTGQMFEFYRSMPGAPPVHRWTAYDAVVLGDKLRKAGYSEVIEANVEDPEFRMLGEYDAVLLLHILEHLREPEAALGRIAEGLRPGGVLIGGFPGHPNFVRAAREARLRRTAAPMGHVSVFSPERVQEMAKQCGLKTDFLAGAYFLRSKGLILENSAFWLRWNLWWGAMFPWWPGEIYWRLRKC